jgi:hypothetical protein
MLLVPTTRHNIYKHKILLLFSDTKNRYIDGREACQRLFLKILENLISHNTNFLINVKLIKNYIFQRFFFFS